MIKRAYQPESCEAPGLGVSNQDDSPYLVPAWPEPWPWE